jgi:hypothetical protein
VRGDGWPTDVRPAIVSNWVVGYGVVGVSVSDDVLPAIGSPFTLRILINTPMYYIFSQINIHVLNILVKLLTIDY